MQVLANGFIFGAAIAFLALAFAVVYLPTRLCQTWGAFCSRAHDGEIPSEKLFI